jgi:predicted enzyme related to lactoylglutathione lyase
VTDLNLNNVMVGSSQPEVLGDFYTKVLDRPADMKEESWFGWRVGAVWFSIGEHSEVKGSAKEPQRVILTFETEHVQEESERIKASGATIVKEPYELESMWIATFADPDGNYFQLMSPWEQEGNG